MIKNILFILLFVLCAMPAFAFGPQVIDLTKEEDETPAEGAVPAVLQGTIQAACAPWKDGLSVGLEFENHVGATIYVSIDTLPDKQGQEFKAGGEQREAGTAVIYRCDEKDVNCNQLAGSVVISEAKNPNFRGTLKIEGEENKKFAVKRIPSKAKCDG